MVHLLAATQTFKAPYLDYHALAPEIVLTSVILVVLLVDLLVDETRKVLVTQLAGVGLLASLIPIVSLAQKGITGHARGMFGGAYVVDTFSLVLKALFIASGFVVLLMSTDYIGEGDYYEGEFSFLLLSSVLGMVVMCSARDLISIFVALELLSLPAYMLAGFRKRDLKSNEASLKYYLLGVLASGVMLYGMSLIFGVSGTTVLADIGKAISGAGGDKPIVTVGIFFVIVGFAFKVGFWSKDEILLGAGKNGYTFFMIVGLVGAFMTAAYMARCVWLTFFGEFRGHGHPHESGPAITIPLQILAVFSVAAGWLGGFGIHAFGEWTKNDVFATAKIPEHPFSFPAAGISLLIALAGLAVGFLYYERHALGFLHGRSERSRVARGGLLLLQNKYYLDDLYERGVVGSIKGPIARGAYWVNQNVLDGVVNGAGIGARAVAGFVYDVIDQKVVDGVVNGTGFASEEGGSFFRRFQTGRVQQYAAFLFGALVVLGAALVAAVNS